ncbi:hypothetical protein HELRODRAFT_190385 [Helobdella robusta]|uniref:Methyltransferase domain-containing protein n=1 Tax=Helobdella robusta TaxID=6412 RepID=T1FRY3_HELRO|nr:hypothetical protein HELRODRAFT_190385 [Helobdella robusta]ESO10130.1 hypothetical protein HELRODRAFT_190385 [Helobdella robusta]
MRLIRNSAPATTQADTPLLRHCNDTTGTNVGKYFLKIVQVEKQDKDFWHRCCCLSLLLDFVEYRKPNQVSMLNPGVIDNSGNPLPATGLDRVVFLDTTPLYAVYELPPSTIILETSNSTEIIIDTEHLIALDRLDKLSGAELEELYEAVSNSAEISCPKVMRLGNGEEGGWNICLFAQFAPKEPCLVYSFGVRDEWSFEEGVERIFNCTIRSFDPSMNKGNAKHSKNIFFYSEALAGSDGFNSDLWRLNKLSTLRKLFREDDVILDYLKIDVEYYEWESLQSAIEENSLANVKQIGIELHRDEIFKKPTTAEHYKQFLTILNNLRKIGFYRWSAHLNPQSLSALSNFTNKTVMCCHEFTFISSKFVK